MGSFMEERELWDLLLKVTLLFALAALLDLGLRRMAARLRHALWASAALGALALPWAGAFDARWHVPIQPTPVQRASGPVPTTPSLDAGRPESRSAAPPLLSRTRTSASPSRRPEPTTHGASGAHAPPMSEPTRTPSWSWPWFVATVWALGAALGLVRFLSGWRAARGLSRRAFPWAPPREVPLEALVRRAGLAVAPELRLSPEVDSPLTFGWRAPVVLVPPAAERWSAERLELVLLHELVHIRRRDALVQPLVQLMRLTYWFHPLAHWAHRRLSLERERACDEEVIQLGARPSAYASHLLELALTCPARGLLSQATLGMAHRTQLEGRLMPLLEDDRRHRRGLALLSPLTVGMGLTIAILAACKTWAALPTAEIDPQEARAYLDSKSGQEKSAPAPSPAPSPSPAPAPAPAPQQTRETYVQMRGFEGLTKETRRIQGSGWIHDEPQRPTVLRSHPEVERWLAELKPGLAEMEPLYAQLDAVQLEMQPLHDQMETIHRALEPFHQRLEGLHGELEPFHAQVDALNGALDPFRELIEQEHAALEPFQRRMDSLHAEMAPLHEAMDAIHGELAPFHERLEQLHESLSPFDGRDERVREEMEPLRDQRDELEDQLRALELERRALERAVRSKERELRKLTPSHPSFALRQGEIEELQGEIVTLEQRAVPIERQRDRIDADLRPFEQRLEGLEHEREPFLERLERLHAEMEPLHERLSRLHEQMEPFHERLSSIHEHVEPFQDRISELHDRQEPDHERINRLHEAVEPIHQRIEGLHEEMGPLHLALEPLHELLEPLHEKMMPVHEQLEPRWERLEPTLDRLSRAVADDLLLLLADRLRVEGPFDQPDLEARLGAAAAELTRDLEWSWSLSRSPVGLRILGESAANRQKLAAHVSEWLTKNALVLGAADQARLERALTTFADTLGSLRYEPQEPR